MRDVVAILRSMGPEQLFLALVFLAGYTLALGEFATARGRMVASGSAVLAAAGFAAFSDPWEGGVVLLGFASVGMALFSGIAWTLWIATRSRPAPITLRAYAPVAPDDARLRIAPDAVWPAAMNVDAALAALDADQSIAANLPRTRATSSSRSVNTAPILNSPGAE